MDGSVKILAYYRMERAKEMLEASYLREKSDYDDFYIASKEETQNQLKNAKSFIKELQDYMETLEAEEEEKDITEENTE